jgi:CubicO group peptidase (beta-lactamase class C family)
MKKLVSGVALLVCLSLSSAAQAPAVRYSLPAASPHYGDAIKQGREVVEQLMAARGLPGFSIAVALDGVVVWSEGFGFADVEQGVPVTPLTRFRLGSVSKTLTAAGVARLVEQGKLDLDAPIQKYVPGFPAKQAPITTRQLANHSAGIRHYLAKDFEGPLKGAPHFDSVKKALTIFQDDPLLFDPGTSYSYSSYGWNLVSAVIEGASGEEFLTYMQREVFEPLGLRGASADHVDAVIPNRTRFYARTSSGALQHAPHVDNSYKWAGGGFIATAEDLVRFASAQLQPGFFKKETLSVLFTPSNKMPDGKTGVAVAWRIGTDSQGRRIFHHGGSIEGGRSMLMAYPDSKVVVAMLTNMGTDFGERDAQKIGALFTGTR